MTAQLRSGLIIACLIMLSACSSTRSPKVVTETIVQTQYKYLLPPAVFYQACEVAKSNSNVSDTASLLAYTRYLESLIDTCNENTKRIKQWALDNG